MESDQLELLISISAFLEHHKIPYMLTGAWSVIYFGRPRASHDIDFVVEIEKKRTEELLQILHTLGTEFEFQEEAVNQAIKKRGMFNVIYLPTLIKLDFWMLTNDVFDQTRFNRRKKVKILSQEMMLASAEDTILQKLRWYKEAQIEKHLIDAAFVYQIQKKNLDMPYLKSWVKKLKFNKYFNQLAKINLEQYL